MKKDKRHSKWTKSRKQKKKKERKEDASIASLMRASNYVVNSRGSRELYEQFRPLAREILSRDLPTTLVVITRVNNENGYVNAISEGWERAYFKCFREKPEVGQLCKLWIGKRREASEKGTFYYEVSNLEIIEASSQYPTLLKEESGSLKILGSGSGFLKDVFVPQGLLEEIRAIPWQSVRVRAHRSWNEKKEELSWTAFEITAT